MLERWDEVLVQRYVEGREVNVGIVGDAVLPIAEIDFGADAEGDVADRDVPLQVGARLATRTSAPRRAAPRDCRRAVAAQLRKIAVAAWRIVGGSGYGRVDLRIDERGRPWILEVNAESRHRAGRRARAHGRAWRASTTARSCARCASSVSQRSREVDDDRGALGARGSDSRGVAPRARSRTSSPPARRSVDIRLGTLRPRDRARVAELLVSTKVFSRGGDRRRAGAVRRRASSDRGASSGADDAHVRRLRVHRRLRPASELLGFACCGPDAGTEGTFDLYWIAVDPAAQGTGSRHHRSCARWSEGCASAARRMLVVETSSRPTTRTRERSTPGAATSRPPAIARLLRPGRRPDHVHHTAAASPRERGVATR